MTFDSFLQWGAIFGAFIAVVGSVVGLINIRDKRLKAQWAEGKSLDANWKKTDKNEEAIERLTAIAERQEKFNSDVARTLEENDKRRNEMMALEIQKTRSLEFILNKKRSEDPAYEQEYRDLIRAKDDVLKGSYKT